MPRLSASRRSLSALGLAAMMSIGALAACSAPQSDKDNSSGPPPAPQSITGTPAPPTTQGPETPAPPTEFKATKPKGPTEEWPDNSMVSHLFYHSLVVDPQVAFKDRESGKGYLMYMVTIDEFKKQLQQIYDRGYVLVSPHQLAKVDSKGNMKPTPLMVPKGKKPLVLSIDDVSYYEYMKGDGFATKLVVAPDGTVQNEYTEPGTHDVKVGAYDVMPIVDEFVKEHPDFAPYGYKGVLALTGYNGVLGYRSSPTIYGPGGDGKTKNPNIDADIQEATKVANALKAQGWEFASHSWGHISFTKSSVGRIKTDTERWKKDVEPITGPTDLLIYPFGADISGLPKYSGPKFDYLKKAGYNFYFNVDGSTPAWGQWGKNYLREARFNVDGVSMRRAMDGHPALETFFDVKSVLDPARPKDIAPLG